MTSAERQALNAFWMNDCQTLRKRRFLAAMKAYRKSKVRDEAARQDVDLRCLEQADIIGITTSGLARNLDLLRRLPVKALLVEEAGEVLEAHTLTALLPSVEHAILIGDHFQLKPSVSNFDLTSESYRGKRYSLDMSLFERLVRMTCPHVLVYLSFGSGKPFSEAFNEARLDSHLACQFLLPLV